MGMTLSQCWVTWSKQNIDKENTVDKAERRDLTGNAWFLAIIE